MITRVHLTLAVALLGSTLFSTGSSPRAAGTEAGSAPVPYFSIAESASIPSTFEQYQYPGSQLLQGGANWKEYQTSDALPKVIEFYKAKFAKPQIITSDGAQFEDTGPEAGGLTVTLVKLSNGETKIILRRPQKRGG